MTEKRLRLRLKFERKFLEEYFSGETFPMKRVNRMATFERTVTTRRNNVYTLRILVGENYPHEMPDLVVCDSPKPMPKSKEWQGTHTTHTWPQKHGLLQICFYEPLCWIQDYNTEPERLRLCFIFEKGEIWLEAYEEHLETGKRISEVLPPMELTNEEKEEARKSLTRRLKKERLI